MKTTWSLMIAADIIKNGGTVAYFDLENSLDINWCMKIGIDIENDPFFWYHRRAEGSVAKGENRFLTAEDHLNGVRELMAMSTATRKAEGFGIDLIIFDSIGAMCTKAQIEGGMDDKHWATRARLLSQFFDVASGELFDANMSMMLINQVRQNMKAEEAKYFPYTMPGGEAKNHAMGIQMMLAKPFPLEIGKSVVGKIMRGTTTKNKTFPEKQKFETPIRFDVPQMAVDQVHEILTVAKSLHLIKNAKGEAWVNGHGFYEGVNIGNGFEQIYTALAEDHVDIADELERKIYQMIEDAHISKDILAPVDAQTLEDIGD